MRKSAAAALLLAAGCAAPPPVCREPPAPLPPGPAPSAADPSLPLYAACLDAAGARLLLHDAPAALRRLEEAPEPLRGFEWRLLRARCEDAAAVLPVEGTSAFRIAWSPDGRRIAAACGDGTVRLLDGTTGEEAGRSAAAPRPLFEAAFSPSGDAIASCGEDGAVRLLDGAGAEVRVLWKHDVPVASVAWSPNGHRIAVSTYRLQRSPFRIDGMVKVFDTETGGERLTLLGGVKPVVHLRWSPDGRTLAACTWDGLLHLWDPWDAAGGGKPRTLEIPGEGVYNAADGMAWSPAGDRIAVAGKDRTIRVFDPAPGEVRATIRGFGASTTAVAWSGDGRILAAASRDGTVRLFDGADYRPVAVLLGHGAAVTGLEFRPGGGPLASAAEDGTIRLWDAEAALRRAFPGGPPGERTALCVAFAAGGRLRVEGRDEGLRLRDGESGALLADLPGPSPFMLAVSPDGRFAAGSGNGGEVGVWDLEERRLLHRAAAHRWQGHAAAFSADGRLLATGGQDGTVRLADAAGGAERWKASPFARPVPSIAFSPDGTRLYACGREEAVAVLSTADGSLLERFEAGDGGPAAIALSPDGKLLALADGRGAIHLRDVATGETRRAEGLHPDRPAALAFDGAGTRLFSLSTEIRVHEPASGRLLLSLEGTGDPGWSLAVSPDGSRAAACSWAGVVVTY